MDGPLVSKILDMRALYPEASALFPDDREFLFQLMPVVRFENWNWNPWRGAWYS